MDNCRPAICQGWTCVWRYKLAAFRIWLCGMLIVLVHMYQQVFDWPPQWYRDNRITADNPGYSDLTAASNDHYPPHIHTDPVDCMGLFRNSELAMKRALLYQNNNEYTVSPDEEYINMTSDCASFIRTRGYVTQPITSEEAEFPISYTLMVYKEVQQAERLIRAIYRPQNYYCIHVDTKAALSVKLAFNGIAKCFPNIVIPDPSVDVRWAEWTVVEAELVCMEALLRFPKWKYHMNLAAQEFPLKTNLEIVKILKAFNGSNLMEAGESRMQHYKYRYENSYDHRRKVGKKSAPPVPLKINKGSFLIIARREFVEYAVHNETSKILAEWLRDTHVPDELFFCTLNHDTRLQYPGGYKGFAQTSESYPFLNRYVIWDGDDVCHGKIVREVCVFSVRDIHKMYDRRELFVNKFHLTYHPMAYTCMEWLHYNRIRDEMAGTRDFNASYYAQFEFTWNHW